jgi:hypothetical protein
MSIRESWRDGRFHLVEHSSDKLVDALGKPLKVDDLVLRSVTFGRAAGFEFTKIREIKNGKVYLASSKVPLNYPSRLLIVNDLFPNGYENG